MTRRSSRVFGDIDWVTVILYGVLVLIGWMNIYATSYTSENTAIFDFSQAHGKQIIWILTSLVLAYFMVLLDLRFYRYFSYPIYGLAILLLVGVLLFGQEIKGAQSWYVFGPVSFQPSELAKFATALALSHYLASLSKAFRGIKIRSLAFLIIALPAGLIMLQPDVGSVLVYAALIFVLYREGLSGNILLTGLLAAFLFILALLLKNSSVPLPFDYSMNGLYVMITVVVFISIIIYWLFRQVKQLSWVLALTTLLISGYILSVGYVFDNVLSGHQQDRINELLGITSDPTGAGYNVHQSKIAIGSGGFTGKGYLEGTQTKFDFVPEQRTDFIFCTIGEEWGFLGSIVILGLFSFLLFRIIFLAERQRSKFSRIYGYCVASILFFHFAVNIGMTIGLAPVIGIPLPFFSYGGSSLWGFTILLFAFVKMDSVRMNVLS